MSSLLRSIQYCVIMRSRIWGGAGGLSRGDEGGVQGGPGRCRGVLGGVQEVLAGKQLKTTKKPEKRCGTVCRRFQYTKWLRVPPFGACRGPPPFSIIRKGKGEVKPPSVQHAIQGSADLKKITYSKSA